MALRQDAGLLNETRWAEVSRPRPPRRPRAGRGRLPTRPSQMTSALGAGLPTPPDPMTARSPWPSPTARRPTEPRITADKHQQLSR